MPSRSSSHLQDHQSPTAPGSQQPSPSLTSHSPAATLHDHPHHSDSTLGTTPPAPHSEWSISNNVQKSDAIPDAAHVVLLAARAKSIVAFDDGTGASYIFSQAVRHHYRFHQMNSNIDDDTERYWKNQRKLGITLKDAFITAGLFAKSAAKFSRIPRINDIRRRARRCFFAIFFLCAAFRLIRREGTLNIRVCDINYVDDTHNIPLPSNVGCVALPASLKLEFQQLAVKRLQVIFQPILLRRVLRKSLRNIFKEHYRDVAAPTVEDLKLSSIFFSLFPDSALTHLISKGKMRVYTRGMWVGAPRSARSAARSVFNRASESKLARLLPALASSGVLPSVTPALYSAFIVLHGIVSTEQIDGRDCNVGQCYGESCALAEGGVTGNGFKVASSMALTWEIDVNEIAYIIATLDSRNAAKNDNQQLNSKRQSRSNSRFSVSQRSRGFSQSQNIIDKIIESELGEEFIANDDDADDDEVEIDNEEVTVVAEVENNEKPEEKDSTDKKPEQQTPSPSASSPPRLKANNNNVSPIRQSNNNNNNNNSPTTSSLVNPIYNQKCFDAIMNHIIELRIQIISQYFRPSISQIQNWELFRAASPVDVTTHILPRLVPKVFFSNATVVSPESSECDRCVYLVARGRVIANRTIQQQQQQQTTNNNSETNNNNSSFYFGNNNNNNTSQQQPSPSSTSTTTLQPLDDREWKTFGEYEGYFSESFDLTYKATTIVDCWVLPRAVIQSIAKIPYLRPDMILRGLRLREQLLHRCGPSRATIEYVLSNHLNKRIHPRLVDTVMRVLHPKVFPAGERVITAGEDEKTCIFFIRGKLNQSSASGFIPHAPPSLYGPSTMLTNMLDPILCVAMNNAAVLSSWKLSLVAVRNVECWMVTVSKLHAALKIFFETSDIPRHLMFGRFVPLPFPLPLSTSGHHHQHLHLAHKPTSSPTPSKNNNTAFLIHGNSFKTLRANSNVVEEGNINQRPSSAKQQSSKSVPSYLRSTAATAMRSAKDDTEADEVQYQQAQQNYEKNLLHHQQNNNNITNIMPRPPSSRTNTKPEFASSSSRSNRPGTDSMAVSLMNANNNNTNNHNNNDFPGNLRRPPLIHDANHKIEIKPFNLFTNDIGKERVDAVRQAVEKQVQSSLQGPVINEWFDFNPVDKDDPLSRFKKRRMVDLECLEVKLQQPDKRFLLRMRKLPQTPRLHGRNLPEFGDVGRKKKAEETLRLKEIAANEQLNGSTMSFTSSSTNDGFNQQNVLSLSHENLNNNNNHNNTVTHLASSPLMSKTRKQSSFAMLVGGNNHNNSGKDNSLENTLNSNDQSMGDDPNSSQNINGNNNNNIIMTRETLMMMRRRKFSAVPAASSVSGLFDNLQQNNPVAARLLSTGGISASEILEQEFQRRCNMLDDKLAEIKTARDYQQKLLRKAEKSAERRRREPEQDRL